MWLSIRTEQCNMFLLYQVDRSASMLKKATETIRSDFFVDKIISCSGKPNDTDLSDSNRLTSQCRAMVADQQTLSSIIS